MLRRRIHTPAGYPAALEAIAGLVRMTEAEIGARATVALAGLTDLVDGTVARRFKSPTNFGGGLDPVVDGLFAAALAFGLAFGGVFPV